MTSVRVWFWVWFSISNTSPMSSKLSFMVCNVCSSIALKNRKILLLVLTLRSMMSCLRVRFPTSSPASSEKRQMKLCILACSRAFFRPLNVSSLDPLPNSSWLGRVSTALDISSLESVFRTTSTLVR